MQIVRLELMTDEVDSLREFYAQTLGLETRSEHRDQFEVRAGTTQLVFQKADAGWNGAYHFAFNIPENQFDESLKWIMERVELLADRTGETLFPSKTWNSDSLYFKDTAGNVLEFIARHTMQNAVQKLFDGDPILSVSEIGLATEDVPALVRELGTKGIAPYKGQSDEFTAVGDEEGLFIVVKRDRIWKPDTDVLAKLLPLKVTARVGATQFELRGFPYVIQFIG